MSRIVQAPGWIRHKDSAGALLDQAQLVYDAVGNPLAKTTQDGLHAMTYDAEKQLLSENHPLAGVKTWTFDPAGNRLSQDHTQVGVRTLTNWAYDPADQITVETTGTALTTYTFENAGNEQVVEAPGVQPTTSTWDANGNLAREEIVGGALTSYTWDNENRLLKVESGTSVETHAYDADGKRRRKETAAGGVQLFTWDDENLVLENDASMSLRAKYTDFPGFWGGLASQRRSGASSFYGFDPQASARILVSVGGAVTDSYGFKGFGEELTASGSSENPYRYVGLFGYHRDTS